MYTVTEEYLTQDKPTKKLPVCNSSMEFSLNVFTEFRAERIKNQKDCCIWTHCLLFKRQRCYHCTAETQVTEKILKLNRIHASVISQILWICWTQWKFCSIYKSKKVLLRERKRHTAHRVASPWLEGVGTLGYPLPPSWPGWGGRYLGIPLSPPHPDLARGVGTLGTPSPILIWLGAGVRYLGVPPHPDLARVGTPLPRCGQTNKVKLLPSPILRMRTVKTPVACLLTLWHQFDWLPRCWQVSHRSRIYGF